MKKCEGYISDKIRKTMSGMKKEKFSNPKQAIAVAYSIVQRDHPACRQFLKAKPKKNKK